MRKIYLLIMLSAFLNAGNVKSQNLLSENFDNIPLLFSSGGWTQQNNSVPLGPEIWHHGLYLAIPAFNGADTSYAEVTFESTDPNGTGNISNWLITPMMNLSNGDIVSFYTTSFNNSAFPDRLDVRLNTMNTLNVGSNDTSIGDFTNLLLQLNPNLLMDSSMYPEDYWGQFSITITGLSGPTDSRIAFRYNVTNGGFTGTNSSTIGIDAFSVDRTVGIFEKVPSLDLNIYPNPVADKLTIDFAEPLTENGRIRIYNTLGQSVTIINVFRGQTKAVFNISNYANGTYSMLFDLSGSLTKRNFIKN